MTPDDSPSSPEFEASQLFVRRLHGSWSAEDRANLEMRLRNDRDFSEAYVRAADAWATLGAHAEASEFARYRAEAMAYVSARRRVILFGKSTRWRIAAAFVGIAAAIGVAWQINRPREYRTAIGEQRTIELDDHSHIALDANTRLVVRYSKNARIVDLKEGQAQFSVAHDARRPFKVLADDRTIIAVGTVFTVELDEQTIHVAMMEGRVAVLLGGSHARTFARSTTNDGAIPEFGNPGTNPDIGVPPSLPVGARPPDLSGEPGTIELSAGEELRVTHGGQMTVNLKADLEAATAWRAGKLIFRAEQLADAVRRVNRYSRSQIEIDDRPLAERRISGVFEEGDTEGFVDAIGRYLPVAIDRIDEGKIRLRMREVGK